MNTKEKISRYLDKHPFVFIALLFAVVWVFMGVFNKDKEIESIKYYLTDTAGGDYFKDGCVEYLNEAEFTSLDAEIKNKICNGLTSVVDETNKEAIEYMYVNERENYEYYKQSQE